MGVCRYKFNIPAYAFLQRTFSHARAHTHTLSFYRRRSYFRNRKGRKAIHAWIFEQFLEHGRGPEYVEIDSRTARARNMKVANVIGSFRFGRLAYLDKLAWHARLLHEQTVDKSDKTELEAKRTFPRPAIEITTDRISYSDGYKALHCRLAGTRGEKNFNATIFDPNTTCSQRAHAYEERVYVYNCSQKFMDIFMCVVWNTQTFY